MNIVCFGLSHRTAGVELRERFAVTPGALPAAVDRLRAAPGVREAVVLSTCNRVECYAALDDGEGADASAVALCRAHFGDAASADAAEFYHLDAPESVAHLFRVVGGLDSMVLGETEISGQVKDAYGFAAARGATGKFLNRLFQRAFRAGKAIRSQTGVGRGAVSVGGVAVDLAERLFGSLDDRRVLVLGAGDTGERVARGLRARGARGVLVSNRNFERAAALATELGGEAVRFDAWETAAADADILISSTAAPHAVVTRAQVVPLLARRAADRPLFIIDLAVPRDVEPSVNELEDVYVYDMDALEALARQGQEGRARELAECERLVAGHVAEFTAWLDTAADTAAAGERNSVPSPPSPSSPSPEHALRVAPERSLAVSR